MRDPVAVFDAVFRSELGKGRLPRAERVWVEGLLCALGDVAGKDVLEAGSGSGVLSLELARRGAKVALLDRSPAALELSRQVFAAARLPGRFVAGDIFEVPFPANSFDAVWSFGVLEHYTRREAAAALREMARVTKPGGLVVAGVPYSRALFYRVGKWWFGICGAWEYGPERPWRTARGVVPPGCSLEREFLADLAGQAAFLPGQTGRMAARLLRLAASQPAMRRAALRVLGGYLLVAVMQKGGHLGREQGGGTA